MRVWPINRSTSNNLSNDPSRSGGIPSTNSFAARQRAIAEADLLDGMERRKERVSFPELGNNCCRNWQPVIAIGRRVDCSHKGRTAIASGGSPETEVSHQKPAMFETRLYSTCIIGIEARIVTELISKIIDHSWAAARYPTGAAPSGALCRVEPRSPACVLRSATELAFQPICRIQCIMTDQTIRVSRYAKEYRPFLRTDKPLRAA